MSIQNNYAADPALAQLLAGMETKKRTGGSIRPQARDKSTIQNPSITQERRKTEPKATVTPISIVQPQTASDIKPDHKINVTSRAIPKDLFDDDEQDSIDALQRTIDHYSGTDFNADLISAKKPGAISIDPALLEAQKAQTDTKIGNNTKSYGHVRPDNSERPERHAQLGKKNQYGVNIEAFLQMAESQLNIKEGANNDNPFGSWYKTPNAAWCVQFVSWCADQVGSLNTDSSKNIYGIPKNEGTGHFAEDYRNMNRFADGYEYTKDTENAYKPKEGDIVFFDWGHTGIVVAYDEENDIVYTIEGNSGVDSDGVYYHERSYSHGGIKGYGINGGTSYGTIPDLSKNQE